MRKNRKRIRNTLVFVATVWAYGLAIGLMCVGQGELGAIFFILGSIVVVEAMSK